MFHRIGTLRERGRWNIRTEREHSRPYAQRRAVKKRASFSYHIKHNNALVLHLFAYFMFYFYVSIVMCMHVVLL